MRVNSAFWVAIASSTGDQIPKPLGQAAVQETQTAITLDFLRRGKNPQHRYLLGVAQSYNSVKRFRDRVDVYLMRQNDDVGLTVSDNGIGIRPKLLPHAFERPQQGESGAARQHGGLGLGLGLAIAKQVVEMHLGKSRLSAQERITGPHSKFVYHSEHNPSLKQPLVLSGRTDVS